MTFSISFSKMLRRMMGLNIFGKSCEALLGFGMIIDNDSLKCVGQ